MNFFLQFRNDTAKESIDRPVKLTVFLTNDNVSREKKNLRLLILKNGSIEPLDVFETSGDVKTRNQLF